ncbi:MAG: MoaD/ThiS family protein [Actinomycetia bacterium]|nr:MoaD/ThiS family protein [Actinomycetes bacterium]MCH9699941.1 MoaD/ThiS family protein [Actinomycetes bacterium]MCH9762078.1 MoaD/ThiS family protein [Actinomycetes bacterium]
MRVTVRYFAAARAAAGTDAAVIDLPAGATLANLVDELQSHCAGLEQVLARCSYLCDGIAVRDREMPLGEGQTIDVLPPFSGG